MEKKKMLKLFISLVTFLFVFTTASSTLFVQAQTDQAAQPTTQVQKELDLQARSAAKVTPCACLDSGIEAIQKAYASLEEDEWPAAIKASTDALNAINSLAKTCKCSEVAAYQSTAKAFLNYAKGGNLLDGEEEPDCKIALKLYDEAISWLEDAIPKITNAQVKANAKSIEEYAKEEQQFVKDECEDTQPARKKP